MTEGFDYIGCHGYIEGRVPRGLAFSASLEEAPLELFSSLLRGRNSFSPSFSEWTATPALHPVVSVHGKRTFFFFFMFYITCIVKSATLLF